MNNNKLGWSLNTQNWIVIFLGLSTFVSLFFVNKTPPLDNKKPADTTENSANRDNPKDQKNKSQFTELNLNDLPEFTSEQQDLSKLVEKINTSKDRADSIKFLNQFIQSSSLMGRFDYSAIYQEFLFKISPNDSSLLHSAKLMKKATEMYQAESREELFEKARVKSINLYEQYLKNNKNDIDSQIDQASLKVESSNPMTGIQQLVKIANDNPKNYRAQLELGIFSLRTNQTKKAEERLKNVTELAPDKWEGYFYLGMLYKQSGDVNKAKDYFNKAKKLTKNSNINSEIEIQLRELS